MKRWKRKDWREKKGVKTKKKMKWRRIFEQTLYTDGGGTFFSEKCVRQGERKMQR